MKSDKISRATIDDPTCLIWLGCMRHRFPRHLLLVRQLHIPTVTSSVQLHTANAGSCANTWTSSLRSFLVHRSGESPRQKLDIGIQPTQREEKNHIIQGYCRSTVGDHLLITHVILQVGDPPLITYVILQVEWGDVQEVKRGVTGTSGACSTCGWYVSYHVRSVSELVVVCLVCPLTSFKTDMLRLFLKLVPQN